MAVTGIIGKVGNFVGNNQSTLLTGMGVTGVVTTVIFTTRATFKAAELIQQEEMKRKDEVLASPVVGRQARPSVIEVELTTKEKVKLIWPLYIPPVTAAATTIAAIVMANHEASKKIAALTVASGLSERALQEYKDKVVEKLGEKKAVDIRDSIAQDRVNNNPPSKDVLIIGEGNVLCFDMYTGRYFQSTVEKIRQAENKINYLILNHVYASLSQFYDLIDIPPTQYSDEVGWNGLSDRFEIRFSAVMSPDQRPCIAIEFARPPMPDYAHLY